MELTEEQEEKVLTMVADRIFDALWERIGDAPDEIALMSIPRASGLLDLSTQQVRRILDEEIDMGDRQKRVSIGSLKRLVESRTIKKKKSKGKGQA